jgi:hypothetical protein
MTQFPRENSPSGQIFCHKVTQVFEKVRMREEIKVGEFHKNEELMTNRRYKLLCGKL